MVSQRRVPSSGKPEPDDAPGRPSQETTDLDEALKASLPGLVIVDGDLELADGVSVDVACLDASGHALFVRGVEGEGDATVLLALDLVRGVRENQEVLYRHLAHPDLDVDMPPLAVLVADRFDDEVLARLACVGPGALLCLERRAIRSRAGSSVHLVPVLPMDGSARYNPEDPTEFCRHLAPEHRDLGLTLVARLARIDDHLEYTGVDRGVRWSLEGEPVCSLGARDGRLEGAVAPRTSPRGIDSSERAEGFIEDALSRALELLGPGPGQGGESNPAREAALDPSQPILTPEEIQAFREL